MRFERFTYTKDDIKGLKIKSKNGLKSVFGEVKDITLLGNGNFSIIIRFKRLYENNGEEKEIIHLAELEFDNTAETIDTICYFSKTTLSLLNEFDDLSILKQDYEIRDLYFIGIILKDLMDEILQGNILFSQLNCRLFE